VCGKGRSALERGGRIESSAPGVERRATMSVAIIALAIAVSAVILMLCAIDPANDVYKGTREK